MEVNGPVEFLGAPDLARALTLLRCRRLRQRIPNRLKRTNVSAGISDADANNGDSVRAVAPMVPAGSAIIDKVSAGLEF